MISSPPISTIDGLPAAPVEEAISVAIRLRPLTSREQADEVAVAGGREPAPVWRISPDASTVLSVDDVGTRRFTFDRVLPPAASNADTYATVAHRVVAAALRGINGTVFTYGQTASGKTHSMLGAPDGSDPGIIALAVTEIFDHIAADTAAAAAEGRLVEWLVRLSYVEVYQEEINDLLQPLASNRGRNLRILRDDPVKGAVIEGLLEEIVTSAEQVRDSPRGHAVDTRIGIVQQGNYVSRTLPRGHL